MVSTDIRLALAPARTYRRLVAERTTAHWTAVFAPAALALLAIGTFVSLIAAQRVTLGLVLTSAVSWSFALGVQAIVGSALIFSADRRAVDVPRAYQLLFLAHAPWSLLMLGVSAYALIWNPVISLEQILATAPLAIAWTSVLLSAFCQTVLGTSTTGARTRTAAHQLTIVGLMLSYIVWSAGGLGNVLASVGQ